MSARFYVPAAGSREPIVSLPHEESHHLAHVLRLGTGAGVRVFDGSGHEWLARVVTVDKRGAKVALLEPVASAPEPPVHVTLAMAVLKSEYMDDAVRDAAMMGVGTIQPLVTARSTVRVGSARSGALLDRWQRIVVASIKQCGRAVVPQVLPIQDYATWMAAARVASGLRLLLAEPALVASEGQPTDAWRTRRVPESATLLVGPEGGWEPRELDDARAAGFVPWTISRRVLRADVAPVVALALLYGAWEA